MIHTALTAETPAPSDLVRLARSRALPDRQRLLLGVAALCDAAPPAPGDPSHQVLGEIFLLLAEQAERDIRRTLAECLADAVWAPVALINMLALDEIEIAGPIIARSPVLDEPALLRVLVEATLEHQISVARRPKLSEAVCDAAIDQGQIAVLAALALNPTAQVSAEGMDRLVEAARHVAALRPAMVRHPRLNAQLAKRLYGFVGQALRQSISERFQLEDDVIEAAVDQAVRQACARAHEAPAGSSVTPPLTDAERAATEARLVAKLKASGQLRPGYLIRAVREERLSLFVQALAALGEFSTEQVRRALQSDSANPLMLACASVGIDRAVFPALLAEVRRLNGGRPIGDLPESVLSRGVHASTAV